MRQAMVWFPEEEDGLKDMFVRYMAAFSKSMVVHLRGDEDLKQVIPTINDLTQQVRPHKSELSEP